MNTSCHSCGARYAIPDERVAAAGLPGLRVRCSRCRAIMVVVQPAPVPAMDEGAASTVEAPLLATEVGIPAYRAGPLPGRVAAGGGLEVIDGVKRAVTGLHLPRTGLGNSARQREWFAAFGGRARGPYSRAELELLAREGRVRSSSLVWRPGFEQWRRVRGEGDALDVELDWLRALARERKAQESAAAARASLEHGVHRFQLNDASASAPEPPSLPIDDDGDYAADRVFGAPPLG
ncbi:MAG: GYF domain-containing protein, partial [Myxococcota bacterium]